jgi:hypothetical protein
MPKQIINGALCQANGFMTNKYAAPLTEGLFFVYTDINRHYF